MDHNELIIRRLDKHTPSTHCRLYVDRASWTGCTSFTVTTNASSVRRVLSSLIRCFRGSRGARVGVLCCRKWRHGVPVSRKDLLIQKGQD